MSDHINQLSTYNTLLKENDRLYRNAAKALGLSECTLWILYALRDASGSPDLTHGELCALLCLPKQTVHSALNKLEQDGYLQRLAGSDRRVRHIRLTTRGKRLAEQTADRIIQAELNAFDGLTEAEQTEFLALFRKYTHSLSQQLSVLKQAPPEDL